MLLRRAIALMPVLLACSHVVGAQAVPVPQLTPGEARRPLVARRNPIQTSVTAGSGQILQFVLSPDDKKKRDVKHQASEKAKNAKQQALQEWEHTLQQVKLPGKVRRAERFVQKQLPVHPQYIPPG